MKHVFGGLAASLFLFAAATAQDELPEITDYADFSGTEDLLEGSWEQFDFDGTAFIDPFGQTGCGDRQQYSHDGEMVSLRGLYTFFWSEQGFAVAEQGADMGFMGAETLVSVLDYETTVVPVDGMIIANTTGPLANSLITPLQGTDDQGRRVIEIRENVDGGTSRYFIQCL